MTDRRPDDDLEPIGDEEPGSDPGAAYDRAVEEGQAPTPEPEEEPGPDVGDVYRSGA